MTETAPAVFLSDFQKPAHPYPTNISKPNYIMPTSQQSRSKYWVSVRGPADSEKESEKEMEHYRVLKWSNLFSEDLYAHCQTKIYQRQSSAA